MAYATNKDKEVYLSHSAPLATKSLFYCCFLFIFLCSHLPLLVDAQHNFPSAGNDQFCQDNPQSCICMAQSIVEYFDEALIVPRSVYARAPHVVYDSIERFQCPAFIPLPPHISIKMTETAEMPEIRYFSKRKYRAKRSIDDNSGTYRSDGRYRRQISLGYPTEEMFSKVIANIPSSGSHQYIPVGSEATLHCYGGGEESSLREDQGFYGSVRTFEWTRNGQPITAPLVLFDKATGDLKFVSVRLADTGIYTCSIKSGEEELEGKELIESKRYQSQLDVIAAPMMWLRFWIVYNVDRCRQRELFEIQKQIKDVVHNYVCHFCPVRNISVNCVNLGGRENSEDGLKYVQISLAMSTLGLERLLPAWDHYSHMCPVTCQEKMHLKIINVFTNSLTKLFSLQILVETLDEQTTVYSPQLDSLNSDVALGCPAGFFENYKLCLPCSPGHYSPHGKSECVPCDEGFFQPNPGSSACFHCPKGRSTLEVGAQSKMACVLGAVSSSMKFAKFHWIIVGCSVGAAVLILLIVIIVCCYPNSCLGNCLCCACCRRGKKQESGDDGVEKSEKHEGEYEKLINENEEKENEVVEENNNKLEFETEYDEDRRHRRSGDNKKYHHRSRKSYSRLPLDHVTDDSYYDDRNNVLKAGSKSKTDKGTQQENKTSNQMNQTNENSTVTQHRGAQTLPNSLSKSKSTWKPMPIRDKPKPSKPTQCEPYYTRVIDMDHHQLSEQVPPPLPPSKHYSRREPPHSQAHVRRIPHLQLGTVLSQSKSLTEKLAIQRRKLGERSSRSTSRSSRSRRSSNSDKASSSIDETSSRSSTSPVSSWKRKYHNHTRKIKNANATKGKVQIAESRNTYKSFVDDNDSSASSTSKTKRNKLDSSNSKTNKTVKNSDSKIAKFKKPVSSSKKSFKVGGK